MKAGFHTLPQVSVGAAVGTVDAVLWYHFCQVHFSSRVRLILSIYVGVRKERHSGGGRGRGGGEAGSGNGSVVYVGLGERRRGSCEGFASSPSSETDGT